MQRQLTPESAASASVVSSSPASFAAAPTIDPTVVHFSFPRPSHCVCTMYVLYCFICPRPHFPHLCVLMQGQSTPESAASASAVSHLKENGFSFETNSYRDPQVNISVNHHPRCRNFFCIFFFVNDVVFDTGLLFGACDRG